MEEQDSSRSVANFSRLQLQLSELRMTNKKLQEMNEKSRQEIEVLHLRMSAQEHELSARKLSGFLSIGKSRRKEQQDYAATLEENDLLFRKIERMQEEHRMKTEGLMGELAKAHEEKQVLQQKNELLESTSQSPTTGEMLHADSDTLRRLQAERTALETILVEKQIFGNRHLSLKRFQAQNTGNVTSPPSDHSTDLELESAISAPLHSVLDELRAAAHNEDETDGVLSIVPIAWEGVKSTLVARLMAGVTTYIRDTVPLAADHSPDSELCALQIQLATEVEEKVLLERQFNSVQMKHDTKVTNLESELVKWKEKAVQRQQNLKQLQLERDTLHEQQMQSTKLSESDLERLLQQVSKLHQELAEANQTITERKIGADDLRLELQIVQKQAQASTEGTTVLVDTLRQEIAQLKSLTPQSRQFNTGMSFSDSKLKPVQALLETVKQKDSRINALENELAVNSEMLLETSTVADKRKALVDAIAIEKQQLIDEWTKRISALEEECSKHRETAEERLKGLEAQSLEITELQKEASTACDLRKRAVAAEEETTALRNTLQEKTDAFQAELEELQEQLRKDLEEARAERELAEQTLQSRIDNLSEEKNQLQLEVTEVQTKIKISEKKASSMMKDTKHQLQLEKRRAERLQDQLDSLEQSEGGCQERRSDVSTPGDDSSLDVLKRLKFASGESPAGGGSGSLVRKIFSLPVSPAGILSGEDSPQTNRVKGVNPARPLRHTMSQDTHGHSMAVLRLQKEKEGLERKVRQLQEHATLTEEELSEKNAIIRSSLLGDGQGEKKVQSRLQQFKMLIAADNPSADRDFNDTTLREVHQLQRRVEEGVIKNIHLQQNVEALSGEVSRLLAERKLLEERLNA